METFDITVGRAGYRFLGMSVPISGGFKPKIATVGPRYSNQTAWGESRTEGNVVTIRGEWAYRYDADTYYNNSQRVNEYRIVFEGDTCEYSGRIVTDNAYSREVLGRVTEHFVATSVSTSCSRIR